MPDIRIEPARAEDADAIVAFIVAANLPADGLLDHLGTTLVARRLGRIVGTAALEIYAEGALLRSVAVDAALRGHGVGHRLTEAAVALAEQRAVGTLFLLTLTAEAFFPRFGFVPIARDDVPASVRQSVEFTAACPASAIVMKKALRPADRRDEGLSTL